VGRDGPLDHQVERDLRAFADAHVGFGPLAWDRPGFEDSRHVIDAMVAAFTGQSRETPEPDGLGGPTELPAPCDRSAAGSGGFPVGAVRRLLAAWLGFLDQETWHVRRAFFLGMAPVLRRLALDLRHDAPQLRAGDLLFCTSTSQLAQRPGTWLAEAKARRAAYTQDRRYLAAHGIDEGRLDGMVERSGGAT
jgi:hypothetical protein